MNELPDLFLRGALALGLGLIIGFQRERKLSATAGIRTFPLFSLIGFFIALLQPAGEAWLIAGGFIGLSLILARTTSQEEGVTTEMAALLVYLVGAYVAEGPRIDLAIVTIGVCALLLHLKQSMHAWVEKLDTGEVMAIMQFVLIALVILPLLPDKTYDTYGVLNPRQIWLMVVLITGISLLSFSALKIVGAKAGVLLSGVLGGLVSSTATTVTMSRLSARITNPGFLVTSIMIASTAAFIRILTEVSIVAPSALHVMIFPLGSLFAFMILQSVYLYFSSPEHAKVDDPKGSPGQLKAAIVFGLMYAVILYVSAWARNEFGSEGLYIVAVISGLIDVDAITISTSKLMQSGQIDPSSGWKAILIAFLSNLVFKAGLVMSFAAPKLKLKICLHFGLAMLFGCFILYFW